MSKTGPRSQGRQSGQQFAARSLYHGSSAKLTRFANTRPVYLTAHADEALGFALGLHFGGSYGSKPLLYEVKHRPGSTRNINAKFAEDEHADLDDIIEREIARAKTDVRVRYLTFTHSGFFGRDFKTTVALYPADDLQIVACHRPAVSAPLARHAATIRKALTGGRGR